MSPAKKFQSHSKGQKLRQDQRILQSPSDSEESTVAPKVFIPKKKTSKRRGRGRLKKVAVEEVDVASNEDELAGNRLGEQKSINPKAVAKPQKVLKALEKAASLLSTVGDAEDIETWLQDQGFGEDDRIKELQEYSSNISDLLRAKAAPPKAWNANKSQGTATALEPLGPFFIFRVGTKSAMLLGPVETFKGTINLTMAKTIGFVRKKGSYFPSMCAFSGYTECVEDHPGVLDNAFWTEKVYEFGKWHEHRFKSDGFDSYHGKPIGYGFAAHVEPKLMLFWALRLLGKFTGEVPSMGRLWELKDMRGCKQAEILLSQEPCEVCLSFQKMLEKMCGMKFTLIILPNLGELKPVRDKRGRKRYLPSVETIRFGGAEEQLQVIIPLNSGNNMNSVTLPAKHTTKSSRNITQSGSSSRDLSRQTSVTSTTFIEIKNSSRKRVYDLDDDDDEDSDGYAPSCPAVAQTLNSLTPDRKRKSPREGVIIPDYSPRKYDVLDGPLEGENRAERKQKKKQKRY